MLIPLADWAVQRDEQAELLGMPKSAADFLEPLLANMMAGMSAVAEAQRRGKEAREICRIGVFYDTVEDSLAANGFAPNRNGGNQGFLRKTQ